MAESAELECEHIDPMLDHLRLEARVQAFVAEHGLRLPESMVWSAEFAEDGEVVAVIPVYPPGFDLRRQRLDPEQRAALRARGA